jgi:hypothetical protein
MPYVAVPNRSHSPVIDPPPVAVFRFSEATFELGLSSFEAAPGEYARIYNPARTVVNLVRLRHRMGETHRPLSSPPLPGDKPSLLLQYANEIKVFGPMKIALDVPSAR